MACWQSVKSILTQQPLYLGVARIALQLYDIDYMYYALHRINSVGISRPMNKESGERKGGGQSALVCFSFPSRVVRVVRSSGEHRLSLICHPPVFLVLSARGIPWKLTIDPRKRVCRLSDSLDRAAVENAAAAVAGSQARDRRYGGGGGGGGCAVE